MPDYFVSGPGGIDLATGYLKETDILDRYVGNQLWTWGHNHTGALGQGNITHRSSPAQVLGSPINWVLVRNGGYMGAGIKLDGTLWTWGHAGVYGMLGDNTTTHRSSPVQVLGSTTTWKDVSVGRYHMSAIKTDGTLWSWGRADQGAFGNGANTNRSSPIQEITTSKSWIKVACGYNHSSGIKTDGTLWLWGHNTTGTLGDGTNSNLKSSPVQTVAGGTNWKEVSGGEFTAAAIKTDGTLWAWGHNDVGQIGDVSITHRSSPVQTIAGGTNWRRVACGRFNVGAIKTDGTLWLWGLNTSGQLGDDTRTNRSSPVQTIAGGNNWKAVGMGSVSSAAIKADGTLWTWGQGNLGTLGSGAQTHRSSPAQTISGGTNWKTLSSGYIFTMSAVTIKEG